MKNIEKYFTKVSEFEILTGADIRIYIIDQNQKLSIYTSKKMEEIFDRIKNNEYYINDITDAQINDDSKNKNIHKLSLDNNSSDQWIKDVKDETTQNI